MRPSSRSSSDVSAFTLSGFAEEYDVFKDGSIAVMQRAPWELAEAVRVITGWGDRVRAELTASSSP